MKMKITQTTITIKDIINKVANTATTTLSSLVQLLVQSSHVGWAKNAK